MGFCVGAGGVHGFLFPREGIVFIAHFVEQGRVGLHVIGDRSVLYEMAFPLSRHFETFFFITIRDDLVGEAVELFRG